MSTASGTITVDGAPRPALSVFDAVMIITGIVIGGGIFSMPPLVAGVTGSVQWMLTAWVAGGVLSLIGALVYAELATAFPSAGGDYHFLTRAYGRDWPIVGFMSHWDGRRGAPVRAFLVQAVIALALIALGTWEKAGVQTMVEFTAPVFWFFFFLTGIALFVLRFREPQAPRPFRVPGYPILPLVFVITCGYLLYSSLTYAQSKNALHWGAYLMAAGFVAWLVARAIRRS